MQRSTQGNIAIGFLLVAAALLLFVKQPIDEQLGVQRAAAESLRTQAQQITTSIDELNQKVAMIAELPATQQQALAGAIPPNYRQDDLIEDLIAVAARNFITVQAMGFSKEGTSEFDGTMLDTITATIASPNQRQFVRFLDALERDPRIYRIQKISIDYQATAVETTLLIETYHMAP